MFMIVLSIANKLAHNLKESHEIKKNMYMYIRTFSPTHVQSLSVSAIIVDLVEVINHIISHDTYISHSHNN